MESTHHEARVQAFVNDYQSKTVKEKMFVADAAALHLHRDLQLQRAKVSSLEDRLKVLMCLIQLPETQNFKS